MVDAGSLSPYVPIAYGAGVANRRQVEVQLAIGPARPPKSSEEPRRGYAPTTDQGGYDTSTTEYL